MDHLSTLKGRIGEAFVETVLRQAFYKVSRLGRESQLQHMFKNRKSEFLPDFLVWKGVGTSSEGAPLHRILCVEVKYRANVQEYLRQFGAELLSNIGEDWPELYVIFVTDHPDEGRSCFQLLLSEIPTPTRRSRRSTSTRRAPWESAKTSSKGKRSWLRRSSRCCVCRWSKRIFRGRHQ